MKTPTFTPAIKIRAIIAIIAGAAVFALMVRPARADIVAGYVQGHGGLSNPQADSGMASPARSASGGLGLQAGLRLLIFEAYADHTTLGSGASTSRGIAGLRGAIGLGGWRLMLRGGGGVIAEQGGALTGRLDGSPDRTGVVARAGVALEKKLAPTLFGGIGLDAEVFSLFAAEDAVSAGTGARISGSNVFVSLHLKFEVGI